ncbi:MAG: hypothetical protein HYY37_06185 [Candidatus Aenigmarchaeota archaeon]|nr:hypothetical protein [Candidatus Aenigmarchaeota archaeon]
MANFLGVDCKRFIRKGLVNDFHAVIGIGIEVKSYDYFKEKYVSIISDLLRKRGITPDRAVYKSYDLQRLGLTHDFYQDFYRAILTHIDKIYFFYSYFKNTSTTSEVRIFPFTTKKRTTFIDFISNHLEPSYPHICMWGLHKDFGYSGNVFLDNFNGKVTNAWRAIEHLQSFFVMPNGDKSNALISTSDILIHYFDTELRQNSGLLNPEDIKNVFDDDLKLEISFISNACLYNIIPLSEALKIPIHQKFSHPIFFIFKEKTSSINEKTIENSPMFKKIIDLSFKNNGSFKFFDTDFDFNVISDKDYFIHFGEEGKKTAQNLKNLGYSFKPLDFAELSSL